MQDSNQKKIYELLPDLLEESNEYCICGHWIGCHHVAHVCTKQDIQLGKGGECLHCICRFFHAKIGSSIELPDVLRAIEIATVGEDDSCWTVDIYGEFMRADSMNPKAAWNLTKPYEGQSDEFKTFLKLILGV